MLGEWSTKKNIKNARYFDIGAYHPNIGTTRNKLAAWRYLHKKNNKSVHVGGNMAMPRTVKRDIKDDFWSEAVQIDDREKFIQRFKTEAPKEFILHYTSVKLYLTDVFCPVDTEYDPPHLTGIWDVPEPMIRWKRENLDTSESYPVANVFNIFHISLIITLTTLSPKRLTPPLTTLTT
jgi:Geminivirus rep protein central domain.